MAYENVRLSYGNACTDRERLYVASFDTSRQAVVEVNPTTGVLYKEWPTDAVFTDVVSLEFDGFYWWTLERQFDGFIVRMWTKQSNIFAKVLRTFSYSGVGYYTSALSVEGYNSELTLLVPAGSSSAEVEDGTLFRAGDEVMFGPSTVAGYVGEYDSVVITGVVGDTLFFSPATTSSYSVADVLYSTRAFWVFTDGTPSSSPSLNKYSARTGQALASSSGDEFGGVTAATFYGGYLLFYKGVDIYWYNPNSIVLYKAMGVDNRAADRSTVLPIYDLFGYDSVIYRLQRQTTYTASDIWYDAVWSTYNTVGSNVVPEVFMVSLTVEPRSLHAISLPVVTTASANVLCEVYDQYFIPVVGRTVDFTTDAGTLIPTQAVTDTNGSCHIVYLGDSQIKLVKITATT